MRIQEIELLRQTKTIRAALSAPTREGLSGVATGATLPYARQQILIDPLTGFPDENSTATDGPFLADDVCDVKAVG